MNDLTVITGGAGFIGSHLCRQLLLKGENIICIDRRETDKIKDLKTQPNFLFIQHDINYRFINWLGIKKIYHLACPASPVEYQAHPIDTINAHTYAIFNIIEMAQKNKAEVIFTSSSEVYGDPKQKPQPEGYWGNVNPLGKQAAFKEGKRYAETILNNYSQAAGFPLKIARIFNTYGPDMDRDGRVVIEFIHRALTGQPLQVHSDGQQTRSFCYIDDLIEGLIQLGEISAGYGEAINLGNPEEIKIIDLAHKVKKTTGSSSQIQYIEGYPENARVRQPDITRARELLGYNTRTSLDEGIEPTLNYYKKVITCQEADRQS